MIDGFKPSIKEYTVNVAHDKKSVSISAETQDSKATIIYRYNNHDYKEFKDIKISDNNVVEVIVSAENGDKETYVVNIIRDKNNDANLDNIKINGFDLDKKFDKDTTSYNVEAKYNTDSIDISVDPSDSKATVYINGKEATTSNIKLIDGINEVEIKVIAEDGKTSKTYTVTINKPVRTIEFNKETPGEFKIENHPFNIGYEVLEDNEKTDDYELSQITVDKGIFKGEVKLSKDIIELIPTFEDIDKDITITLTYNGKKTSVKVRFTKEDYYMR
ncbi:MAG: cadherin-like beta sandwich domain-containing protein [Bacilli bacterium]|nr:cadherin-like beta sandwich domain-containing protein [Bacilli bacterium]